MEHELVTETAAKMAKSLDAFRNEVATIRTGRASVGLLDNIDVEVYGSSMKLNQVGTIAAPEARLLTVTPWDKGQIGIIEKAILASPLDLTPNNDGQVIRIPVPSLTEERRKDLVKLVGTLAEESRVAVRNIRRHQVDHVKKLQKAGDLPEDDAHRLTDEIQKATDRYVVKIDEAFKAKDTEIMEV